MLFTPSLFFFFFSSRRRHTRLTCDWSQTCALPICSDLAGDVGIGFGLGLFGYFQRAVADGYFAGLAVQLEEHRSGSVRVGFADGQEFDGERSEERRVGKECRSRWSSYR